MFLNQANQEGIITREWPFAAFVVDVLSFDYCGFCHCTCVTNSSPTQITKGKKDKLNIKRMGDTGQLVSAFHPPLLSFPPPPSSPALLHVCEVCVHGAVLATALADLFLTPFWYLALQRIYGVITTYSSRYGLI